MMNGYDKAKMSITAAALLTGLLAMFTTPANANDTIAMEPTPWGVYAETEAGNDQQYMPPEYAGEGKRDYAFCDTGMVMTDAIPEGCEGIITQADLDEYLESLKKVVPFNPVLVNQVE